MRWTLAVSVALLLTVGGLAFGTDRLLTPDPDGEVLTLVLLGSDGGPPRDDDLRDARADGFQLLFVSGDRRHATFVSIPRDAYVAVADRGETRINACLNAGPDACVRTVEQVFGLEVDGYVLTSMEGFRKAYNAFGERFGEVTVDVPTPVFDGGHEIPTAGVQDLTGAQALTYARDRMHRPDGDLDRSQAQAELLAIAHADVVAEGGTTAALDALAVFRRHTITDLPPATIVQLGFDALQLPPENVRRTLAPARHGFAGPAAVMYLDDQAYTIIGDAADDGRLSD